MLASMLLNAYVEGLSEAEKFSVGKSCLCNVSNAFFKKGFLVSYRRILYYKMNGKFKDDNGE